jgi:hypothetical protein
VRWLGPALTVEMEWWADRGGIATPVMRGAMAVSCWDPSIGTVGRWQGEGCVDLGVGQRRLSTVLFFR